jgi:hypothetical protein
MHSSSAVPAAPAPAVTLPTDLPTIATTCPSCESHNVSDTGLGNCADCGLTDNLSAFMGGGMTANAKFEPSKFAKSGGSARTFDRSAPRGWTISGGVD